MDRKFHRSFLKLMMSLLKKLALLIVSKLRQTTLLAY